MTEHQRFWRSSTPASQPHSDRYISMHPLESEPSSKHSSQRRSENASHASRDLPSNGIVFERNSKHPSESDNLRPTPTPYNSMQRPTSYDIMGDPRSPEMHGHGLDYWSTASSREELYGNEGRRSSPHLRASGHSRSFGSRSALVLEDGPSQQDLPYHAVSGPVSEEDQRYMSTGQRGEQGPYREPPDNFNNGHGNEPPDVMAIARQHQLSPQQLSTIDETSEALTSRTYLNSDGSTIPSRTPSEMNSRGSRDLLVLNLVPNTSYSEKLRPVTMNTPMSSNKAIDGGRASTMLLSNYGSTRGQHLRCAQHSPIPEHPGSYEMLPLEPRMSHKVTEQNDSPPSYQSPSFATNVRHHDRTEGYASPGEDSGEFSASPGYFSPSNCGRQREGPVPSSSQTPAYGQSAPDLPLAELAPVARPPRRSYSTRVHVPPRSPMLEEAPPPLFLQPNRYRDRPLTSNEVRKDILHYLDADDVSFKTRSENPATPRRSRSTREPRSQHKPESERRGRSSTGVVSSQSRTGGFSGRISHISVTPSDQLRPTIYSDAAVPRILGQTSEPWEQYTRQDYPDSKPPQPDADDTEDEDRPPDGGTAAWFLAFTAMLGTFVTWGFAWSYGIFAAYYKALLLPNESLSRLAWIGSMQLFLLFFVGQPIGWAIDRGHFRIFPMSGAVILVAGIFATSWCTQWWHFFLAQGVTTGLGMGFIFSSGAICLFDWFHINSGKAMAMAAAGSAFGAMVYTAMFVKLTIKIGFPWTMRVMGFLTMGLVIPPALTLRLRKSRKYDHLRHAFETEEEKRLRKATLIRSYTNPAFVCMTAGLFFAFWGLYFAIAYFPIYAIEIQRLSGPQAANLLIVLSATNLFGRLIPGIISDSCLGPLNTIIPSCLLSAAFNVVWIWSTTEGSLFVVACFYGLASGGISALFTPIIQAFTLGEDKATKGGKTGFVFLIISLACLTGNPLGGALVKPEKGNQAYLGAQLFAGVSMLVAATLLSLSRYLKAGVMPKRV